MEDELESEKVHWINNENFTPEQKIAFYEREIELARESGEIDARKKILKRLAEAGVGHYAGEGIFMVDIGNLRGRKVVID